MTEEPPDPILIQVTIPLPVPMIYTALVDPAHLSAWLCDAATVVPEVGGEFRLVWKGPEAFESRGRIRTIHTDLDLGFDWTGPPEFSPWMNEPEPKTHVYVRLQESPEGIDVTLEHNGWEAGEAWGEARSWHFHFWDERLSRLKEHLIKVAYG